jgi:membrane fusion protein
MGAAANTAGSEGTGSLFRAEALRAHQETWLGEIHIATPPRRWIVVSVALLFTGAIVAYLFLGQYTRRETVPGTLVPAAGLLNLSALQSGFVRQTFVHVGQSVRARASRCWRSTARPPTGRLH